MTDIDWNEMFPTQKLKHVSLTQIQNAVAKALEELVGTSATSGFQVSIRNLDFGKGLMDGVTMDVTVRGVHKADIEIGSEEPLVTSTEAR